MSDLFEGGNVFKTADKQPLTQRIATKDVPATIDFIDCLLYTSDAADE